MIQKTLSSKNSAISRRAIKLYGAYMEFLRHKDTQNVKGFFTDYVLPNLKLMMEKQEKVGLD
jgi:hypothetical protein